MPEDEKEEFPAKFRMLVCVVHILRLILCPLQLVNERKRKREQKRWLKAGTCPCAHGCNACVYLSISVKQSEKMMV